MKKLLALLLTVLFLNILVVYAIDIDIGCPAIDRTNDLAPSRTAVNKGNPANASGKINRVEIFAAGDLTNCEVATFYVVSGNNLTTRDTHYIGSVTSGSKQTFTVSLNVETGDYIGIYFSGGVSGIDTHVSGGEGLWYTTGDHIPCSNYTFTLGATWLASLYGYSVAGWSHKWNTQTISKWNTKEIMKWNDLE